MTNNFINPKESNIFISIKEKILNYVLSEPTTIVELFAINFLRLILITLFIFILFTFVSIPKITDDFKMVSAGCVSNSEGEFSDNPCYKMPLIMGLFNNLETSFYISLVISIGIFLTSLINYIRLKINRN